MFFPTFNQATFTSDRKTSQSGLQNTIWIDQCNISAVDMSKHKYEIYRQQIIEAKIRASFLGRVPCRSQIHFEFD